MTTVAVILPQLFEFRLFAGKPMRGNAFACFEPMKFAKIALWVGQAVVISLLALNTFAEDSLPILQAEGQTFTNVVVQNVTTTHLFFRHAGGVGSVRLKSLDPSLQKKFDYDPAKEAALVLPTKATDTPTEQAKAGLAGTTVQHEYALRDTGTLLLTFPATWKDNYAQTAPPSPPSALVRLNHLSDDGFVFSFSILPKGNVFERMDPQRALAIPGGFALRESVERSLVLEPLNGQQVHGFYFTLTDKVIAERHAFVPHRHAWQSQGLVKLGDLTVCFAIESNGTMDSELEAALDVVRSAVLEPKS